MPAARAVAPFRAVEHLSLCHSTLARRSLTLDLSRVLPMSRKIAVVLAAGKGTRMKSELPKVLIEICGRPMIEYVLDSLAQVGFDRVAVVVGYRADDVKKALPRPAPI